MCEATDPLDSLRRLAFDILMLSNVCQRHTTERTILEHALRNIHNDLKQVAERWEAERGREQIK